MEMMDSTEELWGHMEEGVRFVGWVKARF